MNCKKCGQTITESLSRKKMCYSCYLNSFIPGWYPRREAYAFDVVYKHSNATRRPKTGVALLDSKPPTLAERSVYLNKKPRYSRG